LFSFFFFQLLLNPSHELLQELATNTTNDFADDVAGWLLTIFERTSDPTYLFQWAISEHVRKTCKKKET